MKEKPMKKTYHFNYDYGMAEITIEVDTKILTKERAIAVLDFYGRYYDKETDCIGEVAEMCAMDVIKTGVLYDDDLPAIKEYIKENNELDLLGDKSGIKIINFKPFRFDEMRLDCQKVETTEEH